jgi:hypothetical protein
MILGYDPFWIVYLFGSEFAVCDHELSWRECLKYIKEERAVDFILRRWRL